MSKDNRRRSGHWTIGAKLGLGFGAMVLLTAAVAGVGYKSILGMTGTSAATAQASMPAVDRSLQLQTEIHHALSMHRGYMILGLQALADERLAAWTKIDSHLAALGEMSAGWDARDRATLDEIKTVMADFRVAQQRIADVAHTDEDLPATHQYEVEAFPLSERVVGHLNEILNEERTLPATPERKELALAVAKAENHLLRVRGAIAAYLEGGDPAGVDAISAEANACQASVARLRTMTGLFTPTQQAQFDAYISVRSEFLDAAEEVVAMRASPEYCVSEDICLNTVTPLSQEADRLIATLVDRQMNVRDVASAEVERAGAAAKASLPVLMGVSIVALVIGVVIATYFGKTIASAVKQVAAFAERIAKHDLSVTELDIKRGDEIGTLAGSVGRMAAALRTLIIEVRSASEEVGSAAGEIAASNDQMAGAIRRQASEVEQVSGAVTEMTASIAEVATRSEEASRQAELSGQTAGSGGQIVRETVEGMTAIDSAVRDSAASVEELGRRGEQIGGIIETINEIAEQTNLLALNAAIEAARAGEHGRGFAVVADEVRKLAERTTVATEEVTRSVKAIQDETGQAVERMKSGTTHVASGVELATRAGQSLEEIVASAGDVKSMIEMIATAAQQQASVASEVSRGIESINAESAQTAQGTEQSAAASAQLASKAEHLNQLMSAFKL